MNSWQHYINMQACKRETKHVSTSQLWLVHSNSKKEWQKSQTNMQRSLQRQLPHSRSSFFSGAHNLIKVSDKRYKNKRVKITLEQNEIVILRKQTVVVTRYSSFRLYAKGKWKVPLVMFLVN